MVAHVRFGMIRRTLSFVICVPWYTGVTCQDGNQCEALKPCQNGGICVQQDTWYSCACTKYYTGMNCTVSIHCMDKNICKNGGLCTQYTQNYTCTCNDAVYTGRNCESSLAVVLSSSCGKVAMCLNNGKCVANKCTCAPLFTGEQCEQGTHCADLKPCDIGEICIQEATTYTCADKSKYTGLGDSPTPQTTSNVKIFVIGSIIFVVLAVGVVLFYTKHHREFRVFGRTRPTAVDDGDEVANSSSENEFSTTPSEQQTGRIVYSTYHPHQLSERMRTGIRNSSQPHTAKRGSHGVLRSASRAGRNISRTASRQVYDSHSPTGTLNSSQTQTATRGQRSRGVVTSPSSAARNISRPDSRQVGDSHSPSVESMASDTLSRGSPSTHNSRVVSAIHSATPTERNRVRLRGDHARKPDAHLANNHVPTMPSNLIRHTPRHSVFQTLGNSDQLERQERKTAKTNPRVADHNSHSTWV